MSFIEIGSYMEFNAKYKLMRGDNVTSPKIYLEIFNL